MSGLDKDIFVQNNTAGVFSTNYSIILTKRIECGCHRLLFSVEGNRIEIECRRCKKKNIIIYDEKAKEFRVIE
ncbi:MAG: hypothetical protein RR854_00115 [Muribaculaceae bacterium]